MGNHGRDGLVVSGLRRFLFNLLLVKELFMLCYSSLIYWRRWASRGILQSVALAACCVPLDGVHEVLGQEAAAPSDAQASGNNLQRFVDPQRPDDKPEPPTEEQKKAAPIEHGVRVVRLELSPAAEPSPALKYSLVPPVEVRKPGNATTMYYRAMLIHSQVLTTLTPAQRAEWANDTNQLLEQSSKDFDVSKADRWVRGSVLEQAMEGALRRDCDWSFQLQSLKGSEAIMFLLPDMQEMRSLSRMVMIDAKRNLAQGKMDQAIRSVQCGYQMGAHCCREPLLICDLIGIACASQASLVVEEIVATPGSPNLYWALASFPKDEWSMKPAYDFESDFAFRMFPFLKDAETVERTSDEWDRMIASAAQDMDGYSSAFGIPVSEARGAFGYQLRMAALLSLNYSESKKELIQSGLDKESVEKMPVSQMVAIQTARSVRHVSSEMLKWNYLPYDQSAVRQRETEAKLIRDGWMSGGRLMNGKDPLGIISLLYPAMASARQAEVRLQQQIAGLQAIEAIRMHLAETKTLPQTLEEIKVVPVPNNPVTGKAFSYSVDGGEAVLKLDGLPHAQNHVHYVLKAR